jgi:pyrroloquinoline quinone biosynthesis protein B
VTVVAKSESQGSNSAETKGPYIVVLGIAQDAGYPAAGCSRECCARAWDDVALWRHVSCLGLVDPQSGQDWLIDCTPDFPAQLQALNQEMSEAPRPGPTGILLTHAHTGHYAGLIHLGREALDSHRLPVLAMPRLHAFLRQSEPWRSMVLDGNLELVELADSREVQLSKQLSVTPLLVPHRGEQSETVAYVVRGPRRRVLYVPDIDAWDQWDLGVESVIARMDVAFLDGTFFAAGELGERDMSDIPHPPIAESMERFTPLAETERNKICFIHFNHTNPVLNRASEAGRRVLSGGFGLAQEGDIIRL